MVQQQAATMNIRPTLKSVDEILECRPASMATTDHKVALTLFLLYVVRIRYDGLMVPFSIAIQDNRYKSIYV